MCRAIVTPTPEGVAGLSTTQAERIVDTPRTETNGKTQTVANYANALTRTIKPSHPGRWLAASTLLAFNYLGSDR